MPSASKAAQIHLWVPDIFEFKGGIQVYSGFLLETIQALYPNLHYNVFLKNDTRYPRDRTFSPHTRLHFAGKYPASVRTPLFAAQLVASGVLQRPDLVITTHLNYLPAAHLLKRLTGIPYWAIAHGVEAWNIQKSSMKAALHAADQILSVSNYTRDRLLKEQNLDSAKVTLQPNTFDTSRFAIKPKPAHLLERYHLKPDQPVILTVNRLSASETYRGYDKVLEAMPLIRQTLPDVRFLIVGKGDDRPRLEQSIAQQQLQDCVTLAGFVPDEELGDYYNLCDIFAMPSKLEGFGIVYLEAMACGKPVLGGNQDGAIDALCHGELGALVDPDDAKAIAQTITQILQKQYPNPLMYQPEALRQKMIDVYGRDRFKQRLADHLEKFFQRP
ncbi:glycosyltransferase [Oscillatoria sp. FACHB-1407]|uniref:glycosyltransferase n=1 Tax=Oscillatoria sp. FACHB-1407 TaxID=2692847 RepID=UPI0016889DD2|nr:glycosyltransferase [Oscillatoria sp. FACHB-1407]MBD2459590.1 glycosyltransferase [Oscillatoria sp. FACHB-1407]